MAGQKRALEDNSSRNVKKSKLAKDRSTDVPETPVQLVSNLMNEEVDFPRGGGTSLTAAEVKAIRAEATQEANEELFTAPGKSQKKKSRSDAKSKASITPKKDVIRIEHLNYKRVVPGMKLLGQIASIQPLALIISLPNQLMGHVPITQVTSQLTSRLESMHEQEEPSDTESVDDEESDSQTEVPDLFQLFRAGQYVRAVVTNVHASGSTDVSAIGKLRDEAVKASRRIELSLVPKAVNSGVLKTDLKPGFTLSAAVQSVEDHGYILDIGVQGSSGFLSFKEAKKGSFDSSKLHVGQLLDIAVVKMSSNERICTASVDPRGIQSSSITEVSNVTSVLPGILAQALITAISPGGLKLQMLGFFDATADEFNVPTNPAKAFKIGQKVKARILYEIAGSSPPKFSVSLLDHIVNLKEKLSINGVSENAAIHLVYPIGTILDAVTVKRIEPERGLVVEVQPHLDGFIHISHTSDGHVPTLSSSSGPWRLNTIHRARVVGYYPLDGLLQLSLRPSILDQRFLQAGDLQVGEVLKGTVKRLTDSALFVSISCNADGVIWPIHYADIPLKHPSKRFKAGGSIKCRVLAVDPQRMRVELTAKKTLIESTLPVLTCIEEAKVGMITDAVVYRVVDKGLIVQFYNDLKAFVPSREASDYSSKLKDMFVAGKVVKVRILTVDLNPPRVVASIRQASSSKAAKVTDSSDITKSAVAEGVVAVHKTTAAPSLRPSHAREPVPSKAMASIRSSPPPQKKAAPTQSQSTPRSPTLKQAAPLKVEGFSWFSNAARSDAESDEASSDNEGSEEDESSKKKKRRKKKEIEQDLTADMHSKLPESNADFERLLLGSPNSSYLWVQYMSFLLQLSEIDKARETGRRAIQTISFREEEERLNVWIALLNIENVYGTDESLEAVFKDAARHNDSKTVHLRLAAILDQSEKHEKAEDQHNRTCKKFGHSSKVWTLFCEHYLRRGNLEQARKLLPRSLQSLEKRKHLKTISKFAQLEYKLGDAERGKTIFEGIVDSHPKRWDLWSIYMDMEAGQGDIQSLRNIFNRVFAIKMTSHKAKSFFKKWLELERKIGDEEGASAVKQKAVEWTQKAASGPQ
ncbi:hypothetical protein DEU56DRAFT_372848 [Suillus clintonianus]|uniref:uncharacterized protein n=1 Tax=Suillus clintonianus TaxID=1904413 RepID=UPI001B86BF54|nr:uncharacterized protein DEU56DRAFT_372848 [Suillus clintonianus]KAG2154655.1 hypothetical protein DEU56DRAFT_372848 [Suillus clintonianus]